MGIKSLFNRKPRKERIAALDDASKCLELGTAAARNDLAHVKDALEAGADPSYEIRTHVGPTPLASAFQKNHVEVFRAMLETPGGHKAVAKELSYDAVWLGKDKTSKIMFVPSFLYAAINSGKKEIAYMLARHPAVDIEDVGHIWRTGNRHSRLHWTQAKPHVKSIVDLAREKGMHELAEILVDRMKAEENQKRHALEDKQKAEAAVLRKQAHELLKQADALCPEPRQQDAPRKTGKLNI